MNLTTLRHSRRHQFGLLALIAYAITCCMVAPQRPHAADPIGSNPHHFKMLNVAAFPQEIKGKLVTLKVLTADHIPAYHAMFSLKVREGLSFPMDLNDTDFTKSYVEYQLYRQKIGEMIIYAIFDNKDQCLIGTVEMRAFWRRDPGQFGCWLNEKYWGGGRLMEAIDLFINTYFEVMDVPVVSAYVEPFNQRSFAAMKKAGFEFVGFSERKGKLEYYALEKYR